MQLHVNQAAAHRQGLSEADRRYVGRSAPREVMAFLAACPRYTATPLHALPNLARGLGIAGLWVKDEGERLGLGSFKALGGAYAVLKIARAAAETALGRPIEPKDLLSEDVRSFCRSLTFACATDGNHGKSVAAGARLVGAASKVFIHAGVSAARAGAIARHGAEIVRVQGNYEDSLLEVRNACEANGWVLVADSSWPGYEEVAGTVMQGYTVIADEVLAEIGEVDFPTHVFLQAGVGGFAAAVAGHFVDRLGDRAPKAVVVEPERAACLYATAKAGRMVRVPDAPPTVMALLEAYEPSLIGWRILKTCAEAFLTLPEEAAGEAMRTLAQPQGGDPLIVSGESGSAGLAGLLAALNDRRRRSELGLDARSRVLLISTETATDPQSYRDLTGLDPAALKKKT